MRKYAAIFYATSVISIIVLGSCILWVLPQGTQPLTIWNSWLPLLGALVLFALTIVTGTLNGEERRQASTNTDHPDIDVKRTLVREIKSIKEDAPFYITAIVLVVTVLYGNYLLDTQPESLLARFVIIPIFGLGGLMLYYRFNDKDIGISEYAEIDDNGEVVI